MYFFLEKCKTNCIYAAIRPNVVLFTIALIVCPEHLLCNQYLVLYLLRYSISRESICLDGTSANLIVQSLLRLFPQSFLVVQIISKYLPGGQINTMFYQILPF